MNLAVFSRHLVMSAGLRVPQGPMVTCHSGRLLRVIARRGLCCYFCRAPVDLLAAVNSRWSPQLHHLHRRGDGGSNGLANLRLVHCRCHRRHHIAEERRAGGARLCP